MLFVGLSQYKIFLNDLLRYYVFTSVNSLRAIHVTLKIVQKENYGYLSVNRST